MAFYRDLGQDPIDRVQAVLTLWWCEAELDSDPKQNLIIAGTLPTVTMADVVRLRHERGGELPGE
ncbi:MULTISPECIES: hypothetical protein [unclassified Streptomyces]|uniref:hypothetical protein n=1 Tax=unclassified Streptomyces TaxID=2593676 RepID=UPI00336A4B76